MSEILSNGQWLPLVFAFLMGLSIFIYVILDGYDLGVGMLLHNATTAEKDWMVASIGLFWDANETWLVLGVGLLLVAFPAAHGIILTNLYLPVALMLGGLILRGVAFDFRTKAQDAHKQRWNTVFFAGSLIAALCQGYMLGLYVVGFDRTPLNMGFAALSAVCVAAGYCLVGASWLIMKTTDDLQKKAVRWARISLWITVVGIAAVSIVTPLVNPHIFEKWFSLRNIFMLAPIPLFTGVIVLSMDYILRHLPQKNDKHCWLPFAGTVTLFVLCFFGLAYSFFPFVVPNQMTIWQAASSPEALKVILVGALIVLPCILGYTFYSYRVFWGKVKELTYY
jgi:cytochrome d ubiquinol oxidase subunit II